MKGIYAAIVLLLLMLTVGCREKEASQNNTSAEKITSSQAADTSQDTSSNSVDEVETAVSSIPEDMPNIRVGENIVVEGEFWGWNATKANCRNEISSPPVSRSDWIFKLSNGYCIYVSGSVPAGVNKLSPAGERVKIFGTIRQTSSGQMYIEISEQ